jgi:glycosyltransferase involved in cell wall biosynthesis
MARVLIISPDPLSASGGVERFCTLLASVLLAAGHDVRVAGPLHRAGRWPMRFGLTPLVESFSIPTGSDDWAPDILVTNGFLGGGRRAGVRVIHVFHGTMVGSALGVGRGEIFRQRLRAGVGGGIAEALAARGAVNIAVSESAAREARRFYRAAVARIIANGVDTSLFRPRARSEVRHRLSLDLNARVALFVGRAEPGKAPEVALESCRRAGFELLVAGPRPISGARHLGVVEPERLAMLYSACDCVVFPSRYEACSYVVLEALASRVPLVTTEVGWMKTFLRYVPEYRVLVARPTPDDFARVLDCLDDPAVPAAVETAYEWVRDHNSLEVFSSNWRRLIDVALGASQNRSDARDAVNDLILDPG